MKVPAGQRDMVMASILIAMTVSAKAEQVTVDTIIAPLKGETVEQLVARATPLLQDKALKAQRGTIARVTTDDGQRMVRQLQLIQGGIVGSNLVEIEQVPDHENAVKVTMSFDLDVKGGRDYARMTAQNSTLKAHLGELADAADTNPVSNRALTEMARSNYQGNRPTSKSAVVKAAQNQYQSLQAIGTNTATVRSGLATSSLEDKLHSATGSTCVKRYEVSEVSDIRMKPAPNKMVTGSATVIVKNIVDECDLRSFTLASWFGESRTITPIMFSKPGPYTDIEQFKVLSVNKYRQRVGNRDNSGLATVLCNDTEGCDQYGRLNPDVGTKGSEMEWGYHSLSVLPEGKGVKIGYHITLPLSLVKDTDELKFQVVPGT